MPKKNGNKDMTKKLQDLVKNRKNHVVVSDSASYNPYKKRKFEDSSESYSYN